VISVLVVDDSVVVRRLITDALADDPAITVIGTAPNGRVALQKIDQLKPDLVTLDVEMPVLDGIGTLRELRKTYHRLPVIMFSTLTAAGAAATVEALTAGASDYVTKPANVGSVAESIRSVREQLVPRIHALAGRTRGSGQAASNAARVPPSFIGRPGTVQPPAAGPGRPSSAPSLAAGSTAPAPVRPTTGRPVPPAPGVIPPSAPGAAPRLSPSAGRFGAGGAGAAATGPTTTGPARTGPPVATRGPAAGPGRIEVIAIGCSTGGPDALARVVRMLPGGLPVPVLVVQHMPPVFTRMFAERLDRASALRVVEAGADMTLSAGTVYIAPGDFHLEVTRRGATVATALSTGPPENFCRPAVDVLFRSVNRTYGRGALAVVLTGMGHDGRGGCAELARSGAEIVAQDEATSVVWGMPGSVVSAGLATAVLPLDEISTYVLAKVNGGRVARSMEVTG
jgi:two-component system, chemotaxis family, protein-glutamate methylesterase/glutaminase